MFRRCKQKSFSGVTSERNRRLDLIFGTVFAFLFAIIVGSIIFSGIASAYDFSVTIPEGEILEVKLFNSDGTAMGSATSMNVSPASLSSPGFNEKDVVVSVGTSNEWGYNLVMNVSNTALISQEDNTNTISNLTTKSGGYTCTPETAATCDFTVNSWGFKIKTATNTQQATNYIPVPTTINLNTNNTTTNGDPVYLSFGSRINVSQEPGTYTTTINFIATAKPDPTPLMQDMTTSTLAGLMSSNGSTTTLKDSRDGNKYSIANISGNYWMTKNLDLPGGTTLTPADSNVTSNYTLPASSASGFNTAAAYVYNSNSTTCGDSSPCYSYYSYVAAIAGSNPSSGEATSDICPKGWRLPTGAEYKSLIASYTTGATLTAAPFSGVYAGYYSSSFYGGGSVGYYSVSDGLGGPYAAFLHFAIQSASVGAILQGASKGFGVSVRCIFDITMQNVTSDLLGAFMPNEGDTTTLRDERDNSYYSIARVNGEWWMTQNLRIMGTVSASLSNFTGSDFNVSAGDLTSGSSHTEARSHYDNNTTYGAYYNFCAASAGTLCNNSTVSDATSDICPKGWRLPTKQELTLLKSSGKENWNLVISGIYNGGVFYDTLSRWWSSTTYEDSAAHYYLNYKDDTLEISAYNRSGGFSIRCIKN